MTSQGSAKECSVPNCERPYRAKGFCLFHYRRDKAGTPLDAPARGENVCKVENCTAKYECSGYCRRHYGRFKMGLPLDAPVRRYGTEQCDYLHCSRPHRTGGLCEMHYNRSRNRGSENRGWRFACSYSATHHRVKRLWGPASLHDCVTCGLQAHQWAYDGTDPTELLGPTHTQKRYTRQCWYSLYEEFYMPLCRKCHRIRDSAAAAAREAA